VSFAKAARLRHCSDSVEARGVDEIADHVGTIAKPSSQPGQAIPIHAELIGSDHCGAFGLVARSALGLCRALIEAGRDPATPPKAWRGPMLCLRIRRIGAGAQLRIASHGVGFERLPECTGGPPVRQNASVIAGLGPPTAAHHDGRTECGSPLSDERQAAISCESFGSGRETPTTIVQRNDSEA
jgi:hypothetical protein